MRPVAVAAIIDPGISPFLTVKPLENDTMDPSIFEPLHYIELALSKSQGKPQTFERLHAAAHRAGMAAGKAAQPEPMTVIDGTSGRHWTVPDGPCGFAWVKIPARGSFAKWALDCGLMRKSCVEPGAFLRVHEFNQSMVRKEAYAAAYAERLSRAGIDATYGSRLD